LHYYCFSVEIFKQHTNQRVNKGARGKNMSKNITAIDEKNFDAEVLQADVPVVVDFWAEWCAPCRMLAPIIDEVAGEYSGKVKFVKVNVDENPNLSQKYSVRGIPTLILFKHGEVESSKVGMLTKSQLNAFIDSNI
jgi:thioredoxin 1